MTNETGIFSELKENSDPEYGAAWNEGVEAYSSGNKENPYPQGNLETHSWNECKRFMGWNDGYHHAPYKSGRLKERVFSTVETDLSDLESLSKEDVEKMGSAILANSNYKVILKKVS